MVILDCQYGLNQDEKKTVLVSNGRLNVEPFINDTTNSAPGLERGGKINLDYDVSPNLFNVTEPLYLYSPTTEMRDYTCKVFHPSERSDLVQKMVVY
ncbi:hypothetical protein TCAL_16228, partial [Tigriopus californicus]